LTRVLLDVLCILYFSVLEEIYLLSGLDIELSSW